MNKEQQEYLDLLVLESPNISSKLMKKITRDLDDDVLVYEEHYPQAWFDFILAVISHRELWNHEIAWKLLAELGTDNDIISSEQYDSLSHCVLENFINYTGEMICLTVCDFIARYYPHEVSENLLLQLKDIELKKPSDLSGFALDGLRTLEFEKQYEQKRKE